MRKYNGLDIAKSLSIIGIVLMHIRANTNYQIDGFIYNQIIPSFTNLVFLFMMISAFGMCCGYYERIKNGSISLEDFYSRRYTKLWPFFAFLCLLDLVISPSLNSLYEVIANLTLVQALLPNPSISVIGVSWTLAVIFVFYLLFPFFVYLLSNKKRAWFSLVVSIVLNVLCNLYFLDKQHVLSDYPARENILYSSMFFIGGGLIFLYHNEIKDTLKKFKWLLYASLIVCVLFYYLISSNVYTIFALSSLLLILSISYEGKTIKLVKRFSTISFEIYLCHMVVFRLFEKVHLTSIHIISDTFSYGIISICIILFAILFSLVVDKLISLISTFIKEKLCQKRN